MKRIASGVTDQYVYFNPGDVGLASPDTGFTVYRSRNGATAAAMTTPTINETDSTNMPGVYELLLDEDMSIGAGNLTEHMAFWITHAGMSPIFLEVELFDPNNYTIGTVTTYTGNTLQTGDSAALFTTQLTEAYAADGVAPTPAQALFLIMQMLTEKSVSGTTVTTKKLDGSTTALTLTLNDATTPTSITRAT